MNNSIKKKKTAIIVGATASVLVVSAAVAGIIYAKYGKKSKPSIYNKDKPDVIVDIKDRERGEVSTWDANVDEQYKKLRDYIQKLVKALKTGITNVNKNLSLEDLEDQIKKLEKHIAIGEELDLILDKSIKTLKSDTKKVELQK
ncbi:hypothetical protein OF363_02780, partial [Mycoplasma enhydrae]